MMSKTPKEHVTVNKLIVLLVALLMCFAALGRARAFAGCPQDLCSCFPSAANFDLVALKSLTMQPSVYSVGDGYLNWLGTNAGRSCVDRASVKGNTFVEAEAAVGELVARTTHGAAVAFALSPSSPPGEGALAAFVDSIATGGGKVLRSSLVYFNGGAIDSTGASPSVAECRSAAADVEAAGRVLAKLAPTQSVGTLVLRAGTETEFATLEAGPGFNVIEAADISLISKAFGGEYEGATLEIHCAADTTGVVINTPRLALGPASEVSNCWLAPVVINVTKGFGVEIGRESNVDVPILARGAITAEVGATTGPLMAKVVQLRGGLQWNSFAPWCPVEP